MPLGAPAPHHGREVHRSASSQGHAREHDDCSHCDAYRGGDSMFHDFSCVT